MKNLRTRNDRWAYGNCWSGILNVLSSESAGKAVDAVSVLPITIVYIPRVTVTMMTGAAMATV